MSEHSMNMRSHCMDHLYDGLRCYTVAGLVGGHSSALLLHHSCKTGLRIEGKDGNMYSSTHFRCADRLDDIDSADFLYYGFLSEDIVTYTHLSHCIKSSLFPAIMNIIVKNLFDTCTSHQEPLWMCVRRSCVTSAHFGFLVFHG